MDTPETPWYETALVRAETAGHAIKDMTDRDDPDLGTKAIPLLEDISGITDQLMDGANQIPEELHFGIAERLGAIHDQIDS